MNFQSVSVAFLSVATMANNLESVQGHGLMEYPPSRNELCGQETKPHEVIYGSGGVTPECRPAFERDFDGGYQFMSVLTHDIGRAKGRTNHVCGFDSETWQGGMTPWDIAMDWPTTPMTAGRNEIRWNIAWGPHFDDTEEFMYYITKEDFVWDPTRELSWDDFQDTPFCELKYAHSNPSGNPDVTSDVQNTRFSTYCTVPARSGHHVIYGEWGRNQWTYERFHGCIDAQFGNVAPTPTAPTVPTTPTAPVPAPVPAPTNPPPTPPALANCVVTVRPGNGPYYAGFDIGFDVETVNLDFTDTGLDLTKVGLDSGNFAAVVNGQVITLTKPDWISSSGQKGYMGMNGANYAALGTFTDPICTAARRRTMLRQN